MLGGDAMLFLAGGLFIAFGLMFSPFSSRPRSGREEALAPFLLGGGLALLALAGAGG